MPPPERLFDDSAIAGLEDADNRGLVTRHSHRDEVSVDPELLDEYGREPVTWATMTWRERARLVLVLVLIGLAYVAIVRALRG